MAYNRPPTAPNLSPSLLQGYWTRPEGRGRSADELNAMFPRFSSWEAAIAGLPNDPLYRSIVGGRDSDAYRTMFLREAYGLPQNYAVRNGRLVEDDNSLRNGLLGGGAMMGGLFGLDALIGGGTAAAGGTSAATTGGLLPSTTIPAATGTLTTGAIAPTMTPIAGAIGGGTAAGATGALGAGGSSAGVGQNILNSIRNRGPEALAALLPLLAMRAQGGGNSPVMGGQTLDAINNMVGMANTRAQRTDPLHQSITQLAMSRLPTNVQR